VEVSPTTLNRNLSDVVEGRVAAELQHISGRVGFWRGVGVGLIGMAAGVAVGIACYGYSFVTRNSERMDQISTALSKALSDIHLTGTATGTVQIEPREIALAKDQTVSIDSTSRLHLDPGAKILADGDIRVQTPTVSVPISNTPRAVTRVPTISNFTVFKSVPYEKGSVLTGWIFLTSAQQYPTNEYCYYTENLDAPDLSVKIDLGTDQRPEKITNAPKNFDASAAFDRCVWFPRS
jgi:hypothetical protein